MKWIALLLALVAIAGCKPSTFVDDTVLVGARVAYEVDGCR